MEDRHMIKSKFDHLGMLLEEKRTLEVCYKCNSYIWSLKYEKKTIFICKNCLNKEKKG